MAVKAVAQIGDIAYEGASSFGCQVEVVSIDSTTVQTTFSMTGISPTILTAALQSAVASAVKTLLTNTYGITFGLFDTVLVLGGTVSFL